MKAMEVLSILLIIQLVFTLKFNYQSDYKIIHDHIILDKNYNRQYISNIVMKNTKFNRTFKTLGVEAGLIKPVRSLKLKFTAFKWASNVYKHFPSLDFIYDGCLVLKTNFAGFRELLSSHGNITTCPILPGIYYIKDWIPVDANCPPLIPVGNYKINVNLTVNRGDEYLCSVSWFGLFEKIYNNNK